MVNGEPPIAETKDLAAWCDWMASHATVEMLNDWLEENGIQVCVARKRTKVMSLIKLVILQTEIAGQT